MYLLTGSPEEASLPAREFLEAAKDAAGNVPNYMRPFSMRPAAWDAYKNLVTVIKSRLDPRRYELVTVAAAVALQSSYCALAHGDILVNALGARDEVDLIVGLGAEGEATEGTLDQALVRYAKKIATRASAVTERDIEALRRGGLADEEIFDVALAVAIRCFFAKVLDAVGVQADPKFKSLPSELRTKLTVGRDIAE